MARNKINQLAEKCIKKQLPIVEFVEWYEKEGQYLTEGGMGNVGTYGLVGAGLGSPFGPMGTLTGAGVGALAGGAKTLWDRYAQKRVGSGNDSRPASVKKDLTPQQPIIDPNSTINRERNMLKLQAQYKSAKQADPLFQDLGDDILNNLSSNGIDPKSFAAGVEKNMTGGIGQEQAVEKTLQDFGIRKSLWGANPHYAWNPKKSAYEWTKQDAINALNRLVEISPNIKLEEIINFINH